VVTVVATALLSLYTSAAAQCRSYSFFNFPIDPILIGECFSLGASPVKKKFPVNWYGLQWENHEFHTAFTQTWYIVAFMPAYR